MTIRNNRKISTQVNHFYPKRVQPFYLRAFNTARRGLGTPVQQERAKSLEVRNLLTDKEAFISLTKCILGSGCLAMPRAFYNTGWLAGLIGSVIICTIAIYSMHVLVSDMNTLCIRYNLNFLNYSDTVELAVLHGPSWIQPLHKPLAFAVDIIECLYHFGVDCVYVAFIAEHLKIFGDMYLFSIDVRIYMGIITLPLIIIFLMRSLKRILPIVVAANVFLIFSYIILIIYFLFEFPDLDERQKSENPLQFPLFFGTILFGIEAIGVIVTLQRHMRYPNHYLGCFGILNRGMIIVAMFYGAFGFLGYMRYGDDTSSSILNNLPTENIIPQIVICSFVVAISFAYAMQGYVSIQIIWRHYMEDNINHRFAGPIEYLIRSALVIASVLCAMGYPDFGLLVSLVGSFCIAQLSFIYPGIINWCVYYDSGSLVKACRAIIFVAIGFSGAIAGTVASIVALADKQADRK